MPDLLLGPIIGGLSPTGAYLWGRTTGEANLHAWLGKLPDLSDAQLVVKSLPLTQSTGYAGVAPLQNLTPNTHYHYTLKLQDTPPDPDQGPFPEFTTFPLEQQPTGFSFAFGSCFRPQSENGGAIFRALETRRQEDDLRFILLLGDQIYADAFEYNGIGKIACTLPEYRDVYTYTWSRPPLRELLANLPAFMILDDHEVDDDWGWANSQRRTAHIPFWDRIIRRLQGRPQNERRLPLHRVQDALQAYWEHQAMHAPHFQIPPQLDWREQYTLSPDDPGSLSYSFSFGAAAFFVMDARSMRVITRSQKTILGAGQWQALENWLLAVKDQYPVKFLVTSSALLYRFWIDIARDRWSGFPNERSRLLNFLAHHGIQGVYVLAGDLHVAHALRVDLHTSTANTIRLWEFCSSPFEQSPNQLGRYTYWPLRSHPVKEQHRSFIVSQHNFGVVRVNYSPSGKPVVRFEVYGEKGDLLAVAGD
ncbi:MAG: alkaline phosphatase family protein [Anaerolineales bacterium]|nr:alkaline phosphatase family protein [Anaerolineales bacterium]